MSESETENDRPQEEQGIGDLADQLDKMNSSSDESDDSIGEEGEVTADTDTATPADSADEPDASVSPAEEASNSEDTADTVEATPAESMEAKTDGNGVMAESPSSDGITADPDADRAAVEDESGPDPTEPAFEFSNDLQCGVYPRSEHWKTWDDDVKFEIDVAARRQFDVKNLTGREYDDALFRLAQRHPEELAKLAADARGVDVDLND